MAYGINMKMAAVAVVLLLFLCSPAFAPPREYKLDTGFTTAPTAAEFQAIDEANDKIQREAASEQLRWTFLIGGFAAVAVIGGGLFLYRRRRVIAAAGEEALVNSLVVAKKSRRGVAGVVRRLNEKAEKRLNGLD